VPLLAVDDVHVRFGGIHALDGVSFGVEAGQICGLIGPNGAGKTTLFNCLSRLYECAQGRLSFDGRSLLEVAPHGIAALGIARTFQNLAIFQSMEVRRTVALGAHTRQRTGYLANMLRLRRVAREEEATAHDAQELIRFFDLEPVAHRRVAELPFGTRKRVEFARAMMSRPRLLLLDEPAAGLNHEEVQALGTLIKGVRDRFGTAVLLVEHHMGLVMESCAQIVVLNFGRKLAQGSPQEVRDHPEVVRAYLGTAG
jgi:branched-chain amino acid transport system ATP-binding protein